MKIVDLVDEHLVEALENGFSRWDKIDNHPSLKWYREQDAYIKLLKQYQNKDKGKVKEVKIEDKEEPNLELNPDNELPPINTGNLLEQITRLGELREKGFLTDEEFAEQKKKILRS